MGSAPRACLAPNPTCLGPLLTQSPPRHELRPKTVPTWAVSSGPCAWGRSAAPASRDCWATTRGAVAGRGSRGWAGGQGLAWR